MYKTVFAIFVAAASLSYFADEASAQRRIPNYRSNSTISPYVLSRGNFGGPASQYYGFIQPQRQFGQFVTQQNARNDIFRGQQQSLRASVNQLGTQQFGFDPQQQQQGRPGLSMRQGSVSQFTTGGFMNYQQYFQTMQTQGTAGRRR